MNIIEQVKTSRPPREILVEHFPSLGGELPIRGGWGYTKSDACIIDKDDPVVDKRLPFDWPAIQNVFVEKRIYEEMIIFRAEGERFSGIRWDMLEQHLIEEEGRYYDRLIYEIMGFNENDWENLEAEWEGPSGINHPDFDFEALEVHERKRQKKMAYFKREFWFEITSFYGKED